VVIPYFGPGNVTPVTALYRRRDQGRKGGTNRRERRIREGGKERRKGTRREKMGREGLDVKSFYSSDQAVLLMISKTENLN